MLVVHHSNVIEMPAGSTVRTIRRHFSVALNLSPRSYPLANGQVVDEDFRPSEADRLEFCEAFGVKGVGQQVWSDGEFCKLFQISREDLHAWIAQGLKVGRCLDGSLRITETAVDEFLRGRVIESPYLNSEEAAKYLRTTVKGLYSLLERRKVQKLPGSRTVLFTRELLDAYVQGTEK